MIIWYIVIGILMTIVFDVEGFEGLLMVLLWPLKIIDILRGKK